MALATIGIAPSSSEAFSIWAQAHATHHYDCIRVATPKYSKTFTQYVLDPFDPNDMQIWLDQHWQMHMEMDASTNVVTNDLSELDWGDEASLQTWITQNYGEHEQWSTILGVS